MVQERRGIRIQIILFEKTEKANTSSDVRGNSRRGTEIAQV